VPARGSLAYESGAWEVDTARRELRLRGKAVPLGGRAFDIIEVLVQSAGKLVAKNDLMSRVWPGVTVGDNTLQVHVAAVRKALGADRWMLKTATGRGYRMLGDWQDGQEKTAAAATAFPRAQTQVRPFRTNLPASGTDLVGRDAALQQLRDLISAYRVVTLSGPGGIGKSALALEVALGVFPTFQGDVWLVELASLSDAGRVASAVASALGLQLCGDSISPEAVARGIGTRKTLLVLDNCEHVIDAAAIQAESLMRFCPQTMVLATSREALRIAGEHVYRVPALDAPPEDQRQPEAILRHGAVQLCVARTTALHSDFAPQSEDLPAIAKICRRLDGIPLAIELAAACAATLGFKQVAAGLDDRFALLTAGRRTAFPKDRTLRATIDWSYDLLSNRERIILNDLAIFAGAFSLEAAGAVIANDEATQAEISDGVMKLVAKSLVVAEIRESATQFRLLETTRAYTLEKLIESNRLQRVARSHADYYLRLLEHIDYERETKPEARHLADCRRHVHEVYAALDWAVSTSGDVALGVALTVAAIPLWCDLSLIPLVRERVKWALPHVQTGSRQEMQLLVALGESLFWDRGIISAAETVWTNALAIAGRHGEYLDRLRALWGLWAHRIAEGKFQQALKLAREFLDVASSNTEGREAPLGDRMVGITLHYLGEHTEGRRHIERGLNRYVPNRSHRVWFRWDHRSASHLHLARLLWVQGYPDQALRTAQRATEDALALGHWTSFCNALTQTSCVVAIWTGDLTLAEGSVAQLLQYTEQYGMARWHNWGRSYSAMLAIRRGDVVNGVQRLGNELERLRESHSVTLNFALLAELAQTLGTVGQTAWGLKIIDEALDLCRRSDARWCIAELLRVRGDLLLLAGEPEAVIAAEALFDESLLCARQQAELSWELRTSISVARLRLEQDRKGDARCALAPVYNRFTEGFETADLQTARALIASAGASGV
jgi:predicted ATPase/DNA-binding winged helix-turn-helix (wHTH) protein